MHRNATRLPTTDTPRCTTCGPITLAGAAAGVTWTGLLANALARLVAAGPCSRAVRGMTDAQNRNARYEKKDPGICRYIPVFYHTGIYPPKYSGRHSLQAACAGRVEHRPLALCDDLTDLQVRMSGPWHLYYHRESIVTRAARTRGLRGGPARAHRGVGARDARGRGGCGFAAGWRMWKEHMSVSSTAMTAPALSNSPQ